ncbi:hypothetical protein KL918_005251 [Ogataea parapolymorpha]|uniref:Abundant subunit of the nuclear pore complex (NPC) n=1 Tax=Ogataea parapolymorpha (strain ATCC 26012 / BCRC 20466 / JCM 22074 / NRRL Y-7560 / DL-1) TaxID=871575 RepID=W1QEP1_OGAPD|nr:Abundant subunit of the nuclear pore complex (NPC) [Ogataea parapolymorpha DL-1]ESX00042.1 Abundant subunit of the nuclear pore complex (NPC) [Ogataea parapolymorpha DL-1]KAG7864760.1 hypothetical protein KL918_005251 [Ogataea parapolymorpha]KAG7870960.1 hypothetical protein KL916_004511 [Ogataea parapolymorpha]
MSVHFGQVLGFGAPVDTKKETKLEVTELQKRRAARRTNAALSNGTSSGIGSLFPTASLTSSLSAGFNSSQLMKYQPSSEKSLPLLSSTAPLSLVDQCIHIAIEKDNTTPALSEVLTKYAIDSYNYKANGSLGPFSRFEKSNIYNIPDQIFQEYNSLDCITNMGILTELQRAWLTIDNKLIIWNYKAGSHDPDYFTIDELKNTILTVKLVKPKPKVFVDSVNYLLIVATSMDIHILAVEYTPSSLVISDTKMSVPAHGLVVNKIVSFDQTNDIFFTGIGDGENVWRLTYSNTDEWFQRNCYKECLTKSGLSSVVPNYNVFQKFPGLRGQENDPKTETIIQLEIDSTRKILYTLSSKSTIRAYRLKITDGKVELGASVVKRPYNILKDLATTTFNLQSSLLKKDGFKIVNIFPITKNESDNLFLVAVTNTGCRLYVNGSTIYERLAFTTSYVKFPPPDSSFHEKLESLKAQQLHDQSFMSNGIKSEGTKSITKNPVLNDITPQDLKAAQENSKLLSNIKESLIVSPGIFFCHSEDHLYSSVPDYGVLKHSLQYVEDFEELDRIQSIHSIVPITPSFHATNTPKGYCNQFASQYLAPPLEVAALTSTGIHVYRYRTPDMILEDSLNDKTFSEFSRKYGSREACSTALYLACKYRQGDNFRNMATKFYISGGKNSSLNKNLPAIVDNVELSDRFYAVILLLSRLVREFWDKEIFQLDPNVKFNRNGYIDEESLKKLKNEKVLLAGLSITKHELEYFLCSLIIILNFFEENKKTIPGLLGPLYETGTNSKETELCLQAENIGFNAILKFLGSVKEGLSFLAILYDDENTGKNFADVMSYLTLQSQADLSCLTFCEFFSSKDQTTSKLVKEILSSVINKSIAAGDSVELVATTLQEKCGSFCSTGDVLIFKAIESLKKAKDFASSNDNENKMKHLKAATQLLSQTSDALTFETINDLVGVMLQLDYYTGAIELLLTIASASDPTNLALKYDLDGQVSVMVDDPKKLAFEKRVKLYELIFKILIDIDEKAIVSLEQAANNTSFTDAKAPISYFGSDGQLMTHYSELRDQSYEICLKSQDRLFHYEFYKWLVKIGVGERLLDLETSFVLDFLKDYSPKDMEMAKLLWIYYSRRENYFQAAKVLFDLSISKFDIDLANRIQFLSRANGFCNCVCPPDLRQEMTFLSVTIGDLLAVANLQDELLLTILDDERVSDLAKQVAVRKLNGRVLPISDLYNNFIDPLGYYTLALVTFKISDHRNSEDILSQWENLLNKWYYKNKDSGEPFFSEINNEFIAVASRVSDTEVLFPIVELFQLLAKYFYSSDYCPEQLTPPTGVLIDAFIRSGVSFGKLYYNLRDLVESTTFELFDGYSRVLKQEMCYLIKEWFKNDKKLRDVLSSDSVRDLSDYSVDTDPVFAYIKSTGNPL